MAAPTISLATSYTAGSTTASQSISQGVTVDAGDLLVLIANSSTTTQVATTAFTWPTNYVELFAVAFNNASGVAKGLVGVAIKVADGTEDGVSVSVTRNGGTGSFTHFGLTMILVQGAATTPHAFTTNNPNFTTTVDWPAITTTVAECSLLTALVNSDNANVNTPTNWTVITNGSNATGTDGGIDLDKRENVTAGTYDPANTTVVNANSTGQVTFQIAFEPAGAAAHALAGDISLDLALDGAATRETFVAGDITVPLALDGAATRETFLVGDVELPLALDGNIAIEILAHALAGEIALELALDGSILRTTSLVGDISLPLALGGVVARTTFLSGDIALPILLDGVATRTTFLSGDIALPLLLDGNVEVAGVISLAGEMALEIVVDGAVARTTTLAGDIVFAPSLDGALTRGTFISGGIQLPILLDGNIVAAGPPTEALGGPFDAVGNRGRTGVRVRGRISSTTAGKMGVR